MSRSTLTGIQTKPRNAFNERIGKPGRTKDCSMAAAHVGASLASAS